MARGAGLMCVALLGCACRASAFATTAERTFNVKAHGQMGGSARVSRPSRSRVEMMANLMKARRKENVDGNLFVDESCIDCDTCRWMEGRVFTREGGMSAVTRQPVTEEEKRSAYRAMVSCPTGSIRTEAPDPLVKESLSDFPVPVDVHRLPGVFHLGYHAENTFGASPWLVVQEGGTGNVMVDSPRYNARLADLMEAAGGVEFMLLTHIDDVGDHQRWAEHFPSMKRVMHAAELRRGHSVSNVELVLDQASATGSFRGLDTWDLGPGLRASATGSFRGLDTWDLGPGLRVLHTPGHTEGSLTLLYRCDDDGSPGEVDGVAFTGDHLGYSSRMGALTGFGRYNRFGLGRQAESIRALASPDLHMRWILPGHGRMAHFPDEATRSRDILQAADVLEGVPSGAPK